jgi:cytochrome c2
MSWLKPPRATRCRLLPAVLGAALVLALTACSPPKAPAIPGANARHGAKLIAQIGCGTCHEIPGIRNASGRVGPPLDNIGSRTVIAGVLPNTPDKLVAWLKAPQSIVPGNAMPDMGLNDHDARDIAAYLYRLR